MANKNPNQPSGNNAGENLRIENEIFTLKMLAQFGEGIKMKITYAPTSEIKKRFLKNLMVTDVARTTGYVKLYDLLGRPSFKSVTELSNAEISDELAYMLKLMSDKKIVLHFLGEYDYATRYSFITRELFEHETSIDDGLAPGMVRHFIYEDFHPNHAYDLENCAKQFLSDWFEQKFNEFSWELADKFILQDSATMSRVEVLVKLKSVFECYKEFKDEKLLINDISYQLDEENDSGSGQVEGCVKYTAILENNELLPIEGNFKLYMINQAGWWKIFFFIFPGFKWSE